MTKLTDKQQAFVDEYIVDKNGTQAVLRAWYKTKNPNRIASQNLSNPLIRGVIDKKLKKLSEKTWLNAEAVVRWLYENAIDAKEAKEYNASISAWDKLGKHFGIYEKDNDQKKQVISIDTIMYDSWEE